MPHRHKGTRCESLTRTVAKHCNSPRNPADRSPSSGSSMIPTKPAADVDRLAGRPIPGTGARTTVLPVEEVVRKPGLVVRSTWIQTFRSIAKRAPRTATRVRGAPGSVSRPSPVRRYVYGGGLGPSSQSCCGCRAERLTLTCRTGRLVRLSRAMRRPAPLPRSASLS